MNIERKRYASWDTFQRAYGRRIEKVANPSIRVADARYSSLRAWAQSFLELRHTFGWVYGPYWKGITIEGPVIRTVGDETIVVVHAQDMGPRWVSNSEWNRLLVDRRAEAEERAVDVATKAPDDVVWECWEPWSESMAQWLASGRYEWARLVSTALLRSHHGRGPRCLGWTLGLVRHIRGSAASQIIDEWEVAHDKCLSESPKDPCRWHMGRVVGPSLHVGRCLVDIAGTVRQEWVDVSRVIPAIPHDKAGIPGRGR